MLISCGKSWTGLRWLTNTLGYDIPRERHVLTVELASSQPPSLGLPWQLRSSPLWRTLQMAFSALQVLGPRPTAVGTSAKSRAGWPLERASRLILSYKLICRSHDDQWPFPEETLRAVTGKASTVLWTKTHLPSELKMPSDIPTTECSKLSAISKSSDLCINSRWGLNLPV